MGVIGIDIGGTLIKGGFLDANGEVVHELARPTPADDPPEATLPVIVSMVRELTDRGGATTLLGVACAGLVDPVAGVVRRSPNLPLWSGVELRRLVGGALGMSPLVLNDANACAVAEARRGAARDVPSVVALTIGTGVGGGILIGGRLWAGRNGFAGEVGHIVIQAGGPRCSCGASGCLESLVGTEAILRSFHASGGDPAAAQEGTDRTGVTPRDVSLLARNGNAAALHAYEEAGRFLGIGLASLTHCLDPDVFVIGGGIARSADLLLPAARASLVETSFYPEEMLPEIRVAAMGPSAGWIGAALAAAEQPEG